MKVASMLHRRRFQFGRVFWITMGVYVFFTLIGLLAMYLSPMNTPPNWKKTLSWHNLLSQGFGLAFFVVFYFVTLNLFYRLIHARLDWVKFIPTILLSFLIVAVYSAVIYLFMSNPEYHVSLDGNQTNTFTVGMAVFGFLMTSLFATGFSFLIAYLTYLRDEKKQRKVLEEQKMQLEIEKSQANLNFLKAQINPHFLHNTLNFLYAKSLPYSNELSEGILTLSDIMRYALGPAARDGKVSLKDEIEHVRNVIKINQLRFSNNLNVSFNVNGVVNGATTIPFLFITIVENAFKHGDLKNTDHPIEIRLDILGDGKLSFFCRNKKRPGPKEMSTGIGLDNIKKQLDLTYGRNYVLIVKDEAEFYTTDLTINAV
jgi:two-component system, LytTR family, sensor kinase